VLSKDKTRGYSSKRLKAIELLAHGGLTHEEVANEVGISSRTLSNWKNKPDFINAIIDRSRALIKAELPQIYSSLKKRCVKGSAQHMKILFDHLDKLEEMQSMVSANSITVIWKNQDDASED